MPKTILITRPVEQAANLSHLIQSAGGETLLFPTIVIAPIKPLEPGRWSSAAKWASVIIFVSANAVQHSMPYLQEIVVNKIVIAIGPGTALALERHGVIGVTVPAVYNSEGIIALLLEQRLIYNNLLIVCGEQPREYLKQALAQRGACVKIVECYRRLWPDIDDASLTGLQQKKIDVIVTTSREGLKHLYEIFKDRHSWLCALPVVVISPQMATQAEEYGFKQIRVADNATDQAIMKTLLCHFL